MYSNSVIELYLSLEKHCIIVDLRQEYQTLANVRRVRAHPTPHPNRRSDRSPRSSRRPTVKERLIAVVSVVVVIKLVVITD